MCDIEPSDLAGELTSLKIGKDSVDWYQQEIDRFHGLTSELKEQASADESDDTETVHQLSVTQYIEMLDSFTKPFRQA
jgi:hypothetical protein